MTYGLALLVPRAEPGTPRTDHGWEGRNVVPAGA